MTTRVRLIAATIAGVVLTWSAMQLTASARQTVMPSASDLRFELLGNEPIAGPDGRALVSGWSVLMFKDRRTGQCYVALKNGDSIAMESAACAK